MKNSNKLDIGFKKTCSCPDNHINCLDAKEWIKGQVALTLNEWFKAKRFKNQYWLYVVCNAVKNPTLYIINNPAENLNIEEKVEVVRFLVSSEEWKKKGVKV